MADGDIDLDLSVSTADLQGQLRGVSDELQKVVLKAGSLKTALKDVARQGPDEFKRLRGVVGRLGLGGVDAGLANAQLKGLSARASATEVGQLGQIARLYERIAKSGLDSLRLAGQQVEAAGRNEKVERARFVVAQRRLQLGEALLRNEGQWNAETTKSLEKLQAAQSLLAGIVRQERERAEAVRQANRALEQENRRRENQARADAARAAREAQARTPEARQARAQFRRDETSEYLFGDGGKNLFAVQTRLFAQYQVISGAVQSVRFLLGGLVELDAALRKLQAISGSTDAEMVRLRGTILEVGQASMFSLGEIAEASTTLAQAGLQAGQVQAVLADTVKLATASGSGLQETVDLVTSALSVFNLRADETGRVADVVSAGLNLTKLTVDKLALGLQYAGNVAADAGVGFNELVAVLGEFANAGVRSGSTLGTGVRQLIVDLQNPSDELAERLRALGLSQQDVSIRGNGLVGVLKNLREAGFSTADAVGTLEVRAAAAFSALTRRLPDIDRLQVALTTMGGAAKGAEVQLESIASKLTRFQNAVLAAGSSASEDFNKGFGRLLDGSAAVIASLGEQDKAVSILGAGLASLAGGALLVTASRFVGLTAAAGALKAGLLATAAGTTTFGAALAGLAFAPVTLAAGALFVGIAALTDGFGLFAERGASTGRTLEGLQQRINETDGRIGELEESVRGVDGEIRHLIDRAVRLDREQGELNATALQAKARFGALGLQFDDTRLSVDGLLAAYQNLRASLAQGLDVNLNAQSLDLREQAALMRRQIREKRREDQAWDLLDGFGFTPMFRTRSGLGTTLLKAEQGNPEVAAGVRALLSPPDNADAVFALIRPLQERLKAGGLADAEKRATENLVKELRNLAGQLQEAAGKEQLAGLKETQAEDAAFRGRVGPGILQAIEASRLEFNRRFASQVEPLKEAGQQKAAAGALLEQTKAGFRNAVEAAISALPEADRQKARDAYRDEIASFEAETSQLLKGTVDKADEELKEVYKAQLGTIDRQVRNLKRKLSGKATGDDPEVQAQLKALLEQRAGILGQLTDIEEKGKSSTVISSIKAQHREDVENELDDVARAAGEAAGRVRKQALTEQIQLVEEELRVVERKLAQGKAKDPSGELARRKQLQDRLEQLRIRQIREDGTDPATAEKRISLLREGRRLDDEEFGDRRTKVDRRQTYEYEPLARDEDLSSLSKPFATLNKEFDTRLKAAGRPLAELQARIQALDLPQNRRDMPDYVKGQLARKAEGLETNELLARSLVDRARVQALQALIKEIQAQRDVLDREVAELDARLKEGDGKLPAEEGRKLEGDRDEKQKRAKRIEEQVAQAQAQIEEATQRADEAFARYQERIQELTPADWARGVSEAFDVWAEAAGVFDSRLKIIGDTATHVFGELRSNIAATVKEWASGSASMGEAIANFGRRFLETMLDIAANQAANQVLGLLGTGLRALAGAAGPRTPVPGPGSTAVNGMLGRASGGGRVRGGVPGRDSAHYLLEPGEFVVRKKAVDAIGEDALRRMNATGEIPRAAAAAIVPMAAGGSNQQVDVYVVSPDQVPPPNESTVVAWVARDMQRGGPIKQLVKSISNGMA